MKSPVFSRLLALITVIMVLFTFCSVAYASTGTQTGTATPDPTVSAAGADSDAYLRQMGAETFNLYRVIRNISIPFCALTLGYLGFQVLFASWLGKSDVALDKIKHKIMLTFGAVLCIIVLPGIMGWAMNYVSAKAWDPPTGLQPLVGDWSIIPNKNESDSSTEATIGEQSGTVNKSSPRSAKSLNVESGTISGHFNNPNPDPDPTDNKQPENLEYWVYVPENVTTNMPLIVFLHGHGRESDMEGIKNYGMMYKAKQIYGENFPFIGLQPCSPSYGWEDKPLKELIDYIVDIYQVNPNKIILTGHSMGALGVWNYMGAYGDYFSAAVPVSWWASSNLPESYYKNWAEIPTRGYYSLQEAEKEYPDMAPNMRKTIDKILDCGGSAELIAIENKAHWETTTAPYTKELFEWMLSQ